MKIILLSPAPWDIDDKLFANFDSKPVRIVRALETLGDVHQYEEADVIFLGGYTADQSINIIHLLHNALPSIAIVPLLNEAKSDYLLTMMRMGAFDILIDQNQASISQILARVEEAGRKARRGLHKDNQSIGFFSAKGGDGASFTISNFVTALADKSDKSFALLDLALPFGDLEVYLLGTKPVHYLDDFINEISRMDEALVHSMAHPLARNVALIAAPPTFERIVNISAENIIQLIERLKSAYDYVLVDMGTLVTPTSLSIIEKIDMMMMVASPSIASLRHASQMLHLLQSLDYPAKNISVILNRMTTQSAVTQSEFENILGKSLEIILPDCGSAADNAIARARSLYDLAPKSAYSQATAKWASKFLGVENKGYSIWHRLKIK